ncbi:PKD domain-containing protein [Chryseolinea lacunae]|uniref:PKD domain-containing protein n=1 Tax=Chryseolinea lacunae TaxID=2801331 RepID=A0ABS1L2M9_9BACT|nr:PKD domain-containing protein [Chryseolinea lacunae]MBL0744801.1 PKD domain-containing protein [Chryseolinea lacunae]
MKAVMKIFLMLCFVLVLWCVVSDVKAQAIAQSTTTSATDSAVVFDVIPDSVELRALTTFYKDLGGPHWKNNRGWLKGTMHKDFATWYGVTVENGDVVEIVMPHNNLNGIRPGELGRLGMIRYLSLEGNNVKERERRTMSHDVAAFPKRDADTRKVNLPYWGLAVKGPHAQKVDWRSTPPTIDALTAYGASNIGATGVGVDQCGGLAFMVLHNGLVGENNLHIYDADGNKLTTTGLNGILSNNEMQVVKVPGKQDEWYVIYTKYRSGAGCPDGNAVYCAADVVYSRIQLNTDTRQLTILEKDRLLGSGYIQGKAVSRTVNGDVSKHYLYLVKRVLTFGYQTDANAKIQIHRYTVSESGITLGSEGVTGEISLPFWSLSIASSGVELSPDETTLCISNRNQNSNFYKDIVIFNLGEFSSPSPNPKFIDLTQLMVQPDGALLNQAVRLQDLYTLSGYKDRFSCFEFLKNKISLVEFSPSGRFLYAIGGGFQVGQANNRSYNEYLLQIDLDSDADGTEYNVSIRIQKGFGVESSCVGGSVSDSNHHPFGDIEASYDGNIYFTKGNEKRLFVIPHPNEIMQPDLTPKQVDLSTADVPNIPMQENAIVTTLPENIDGLDYIPDVNLPNPSFAFLSTTAGTGSPTTLLLSGHNAGNTYQVAWGDGTFDNLSTQRIAHTYTTPGTYTVVMSATNALGCNLKSNKQLVVEERCPTIGTMDFSASTILCSTTFEPSVQFPNTCVPVSYTWNFGDGGTSTRQSPLHSFRNEGTYNVTLKLRYQCGACKDSVSVTKQITVRRAIALIDSLITVTTELKTNVIQTQASTFFDAWPLDYTNTGLSNLSGYLNGSAGVWRNNASYVYDVPRSQSDPVTIATDGTFTLEMFNWESAQAQLIPHWINATIMTRYSPYSYELENKDVLDVYSAALYDYGGHLPSANGVNMRNNEMAYTGFEGPGKRASGNWMLSNDAEPTYLPVTVTYSKKNIAIAKAPVEIFDGVEAVDVLAHRLWWRIFFRPTMLSKYMSQVPVLCVQQHPTDRNQTIVVLEDYPFKDVWFGILRIRNQARAATAVTFDSTIYHTGRRSIKVTTAQTFEQKLLRLDSGKKYFINAWAFVRDPQRKTPEPVSGLGIDGRLKAKNGTLSGSFSIAPSGPVIEGWQQVRGTFVCPDDGLMLEVTFKPGTSGAWYDDLRLHPDDGNMTSYVYDLRDYRLRAVLDEENFATLYFYDDEGNLYLTKKETTDGIKTLSETVSYVVEH